MGRCSVPAAAAAVRTPDLAQCTPARAFSTLRPRRRSPKQPKARWAKGGKRNSPQVNGAMFPRLVSSVVIFTVRGDGTPQGRPLRSLAVLWPRPSDSGNLPPFEWGDVPSGPAAPAPSSLSLLRNGRSCHTSPRPGAGNAGLGNDSVVYPRPRHAPEIMAGIAEGACQNYDLMTAVEAVLEKGKVD